MHKSSFKGYTNLIVFCDGGVSGVTMERPSFKETKNFSAYIPKMTIDGYIINFDDAE